MPKPPASRSLDPDEIARLRAVIGRLSKRLNALVGDTGLSPSQLSVLGTIARRGPIGIGELASAEALNPTMLSRIVGKLEDHGLIARAVHPDDARAALVEATPDGGALYERIRANARLLTERLNDLAPERATQILDALPALELLAEQLQQSLSRSVARTSGAASATGGR